MDVITSDFEVTTYSKGNPFDKRNRAVCLGSKRNDTPVSVAFSPDIQAKTEECLYVCFNAKFDAHWYRRQGFQLPTNIWCCQVAEFLFSGFTERYPSLESTAQRYGLGHKIDLIKEEFWERKCTCHVSIAERLLQNMQKDYALNAIIADTKNNIELNGFWKNENGEKTIQNVIKLFCSDELKNYEMILRQRLEHVGHTTNENTKFQMLSMIHSWLQKTVKFAEKLKIPYAQTTAIERAKLEACCVEHVILLWDMLIEQSGWKKHSDICKGHNPLNTDQIPQPILEEYCKQDVELTYQIYLKQVERFAQQPELYKLFKLYMHDLLVLEDMEWNGQKYDEELCNTKAEVIDTEIAEIINQLNQIYPDIPINFNSPDQLSAFLYGGTISQTTKVLDGFYGPKAQKAGQPKYKNLEVVHQLPRLIEPLKGSELQKEGIYATDTSTLRKLKGVAAKKFVKPLLRLSELDKLNSTYYRGLPAKNEEKHWPKGMIHGQFNQVVAATSRLSSSDPNLQNFATDCLDVFVTRYDY